MAGRSAKPGDPMTARTRRRVVQGIACLGSLLSAALLGAGCSEKTYPVSLTFTLADGAPLSTGFVTVQHTSITAILGGGGIAADGSCRPVLRGRSAPGLPAGTYRVGVTAGPVTDFDAPPPPLPFSLDYTNPAGSGLTFTVDPADSAHHTFTLAKPAASRPMPRAAGSQ